MVSEGNRDTARDSVADRRSCQDPSSDISIACCTYNGADFIGDQMLSLTRQSRLPDEIIICDDGSTDRTLELVARIGDSSTIPIRLFRNSNTLGCTKNFEKAVSLCRGDIIALCDQDDIWLPNKLSKIEAEFRRRPNIGAVFSNGLVVDSNRTPTGYTLWDAFGLSQGQFKQVSDGDASAPLLKHFFVTGATLAFKREFLKHLLPIPGTWPHDAWIASVLSYVAPLVPIPKSLILYRQHGSNQIGASRNLSSRFIHPWTQDQGRYFNGQIEMFKTLHRHLDDRRLATRAQLNDLSKKVQHLEFRKRLPVNRLLRIPHVVRSVCRGEYDTYSRHRLSAVRDLLSSRSVP